MYIGNTVRIGGEATHLPSFWLAQPFFAPEWLEKRLSSPFPIRP
jgi:hypothetical protein